MISTVEDVELIDPSLSSERLVYRLFHEPGVRVFRGSPLRAECSCSRDNVEAMLKSFSQDDRDHMVEDGKTALLVPPQLRFARGWLAGALSERGEGFQPFERWSQIADHLQKAEC